MKTSLRKLGNSKCVLIPAAILAACGMTSDVELSVEGGRIVIEPCRPTRDGWAEASVSLSSVHEDALIWPEFGNSEDENWEWQHRFALARGDMVDFPGDHPSPITHITPPKLP